MTLEVRRPEDVEFAVDVVQSPADGIVKFHFTLIDFLVTVLIEPTGVVEFFPRDKHPTVSFDILVIMVELKDGVFHIFIFSHYKDTTFFWIFQEKRELF